MCHIFTGTGLAPVHICTGTGDEACIGPSDVAGRAEATEGCIAAASSAQPSAAGRGPELYVQNAHLKSRAVRLSRSEVSAMRGSRARSRASPVGNPIPDGRASWAGALAGTAAALRLGAWCQWSRCRPGLGRADSRGPPGDAQGPSQGMRGLGTGSTRRAPVHFKFGL